jgi:hypothetical protein
MGRHRRVVCSHRNQNCGWPICLDRRCQRRPVRLDLPWRQSTTGACESPCMCARGVRNWMTRSVHGSFYGGSEHVLLDW